MSDILNKAIKAVKESQYSFCKLVSPNDAGETGGHQAGLYIPKTSISLLFDEPGVRGDNKERFVDLIWENGQKTECRFIYYGKGSRNEYRITRLGRHFKIGDFIVITKTKDFYQGFLFTEITDVRSFMQEFSLKVDDTNKLINIGIEPINSKDNNLTLFPENDVVKAVQNENVEVNEINFKPKAHILSLLGEELIKSPVMAIYELIKNGYDADAKDIIVSFENIEDVKKAKISITDSGTGIKEDILINVWFEPGTDFRKPFDANGKRTITRSPIYHRIPMGEKGVGRFAVHKLGRTIKMTSRPANVILNDVGEVLEVVLLDYELELEINWDALSQSEYLNDVTIEWRKKYDLNNFLFKNRSGTTIEIAELKEPWTRGMARQLKRQTISMLSPKNDNTKFEIKLDFKNNWLSDIPDVFTVLAQAPYKLDAFVDEDYNLTFEYNFELKNNNKIGERKINADTIDEIDKPKYKRNIRLELRKFYEAYLHKKEYKEEAIEELLKEYDKQKLPYGNLMLEFYSFDLDSVSLRDTSSNPSLVKGLLKDHAGVKVFKGDLRVYDYGDPGNDWLGLDLKRVQNKTWFSNNQNIGFVYLDPATSSGLVEKTNREGFLENESYFNLLTLLEYLLSEFKAERNSDRGLWRRYNKVGIQNTFEAQLSGFRTIIAETDLTNEEQRTKLLEEADKIEARYEEDKESLLIPAGVGMTASFAMHEIEKLVPRLKESVREKSINTGKLNSLVDELEDYVNGVLSVLQKGGGTKVPLRETIEIAVKNYSSRLKKRNIEVEYKLEENAVSVLCDKRMLVTMLMNLIDNSIYWLETIHKPEKRICFITRKEGNSISIIVADNGPGFKDRIEDIIRPFFTRKENGIGIGMYLIDTVMIQYGKLEILYTEEEKRDADIPEYCTGAVVQLTFSKLNNS